MARVLTFSSTSQKHRYDCRDDFEVHNRCNNSLGVRVRNGNYYCGRMSTVLVSRCNPLNLITVDISFGALFDIAYIFTPTNDYGCIRRASNLNACGPFIAIRPKSLCAGFKRKLYSPSIRAEGTLRIALVPAFTQSEPIF